jgi:hypothetical protein
VHGFAGLHLRQVAECRDRVVAAALRVQAQRQRDQCVDVRGRLREYVAAEAFGFDRIAAAERGDNVAENG